MTIGLQPEVFPHGSFQGNARDRIAVVYAPGHGRSEKETQDAYWPQNEADSTHTLPDYLTSGRLYIVADGVSKCTDGRLAGTTAVRELAEHYYRSKSDPASSVTESNLHDKLARSILKANDALLGLAEDDAKQGRPGEAYQTTIVCALIYGDRLYTAHVGDSRIYLVRQGSWEQITQDHVGADQVLNQALGVDKRLTEEVVRYAQRDLLPGDIVLLCTDGIYKEFADISGLQQSFAGETGADYLEERCRKLYNAATAKPHGDKDDMTLLAIYCAIPAANEQRKLDADFAQLYVQAGGFDAQASLDQTQKAVEVLETICWWRPKQQYAERTYLERLGQLYFLRSTLLVREGKDAALAQRLSKAALRLGYQDPQLLARNLLDKQQDQWKQASSPEKRAQLLTELLVWRQDSVWGLEEPYWATVSRWLKELGVLTDDDGKGRGGLQDAERWALSLWALTIEQAEKQRGAYRSCEEAREIVEGYWRRERNKWDEIGVELHLRAIEGSAIKGQFDEKMTDPLIYALALCKFLGPTNSRIWSRQDLPYGRINALAVARGLLDRHVMRLLRDQKVEAAWFIAQAYKHWPEMECFAQEASPRGLAEQRTQDIRCKDIYKQLEALSETSSSNGGNVPRNGQIDRTEWHQRFREIQRLAVAGKTSEQEQVTAEFDQRMWLAAGSQEEEKGWKKLAALFRRKRVQLPKSIDQKTQLMETEVRRFFKIELQPVVRSLFSTKTVDRNMPERPATNERRASQDSSSTEVLSKTTA